jgi:hypothetical protein
MIKSPLPPPISGTSPPPSVPSDTLFEELMRDSSNDSPLHMAVISGDLKTLEMMLPVMCKKKAQGDVSMIIDSYDEGG